MISFPRPRALWIAPVLLALAAAPSAAQSEAKMSGDVAGPDGAPVAGVTVRLESTDAKGATVAAESNKKGHYLIGMLRPGAYHFVVDTHNAGLVALRVKGKAINPDAGRAVLWEVDQDISSGKPPDLSVGSRNQIELDITVGPPSMTTAARKEAETKAANDAFAQGHELVRAGDYNGALAKLVPLTENVSDHAPTWYLIGFSRERLGQWDDALTAVDRCLAIDPSLGGAHLLRGRIFKGQGRLDEAAAEVRREIDAKPDPSVLADAWVVLASIEKAKGRRPEEIQALESAVGIDPKRRELFLELAQLYADAGQREQAASALERADQAGGSDDTVFLNLAIGYLNDGRLDDAKRLATRLIGKGSTNPNLSIAHSILARCALGGGNTAEGVRELETALSLDPESRLAAENREMLAALKRK